MFNLDTGLPAELVPLSWLLGVWEGTGVINYKVGERTLNHEFGQRVSFSHDGLPVLNYNSYTWLLGQDGEDVSPLVTETGYWRLSRPSTDADAGPGMLPGVGGSPYSNADQVETLRTPDGGFEVEASILSQGGVSELYLGTIAGPRIDLATDAVMRSATAKDYSAATRLYGLVEGHLLWAWDIAALGQGLRTHASARLARVD